MENEELFKSLGGQSTVLVGSDPSDPNNVIWNFGVQPPTQAVENLIQSKPSLYARFPAMKGKWDGKSTVNHWNAINQVAKEQGFNPLDLVHYQPRGTCGARAGAFAGETIQCVRIAAGEDAKFRRVSHAAVYFTARKLYGMLKGDWRDERNDGVASGSVPEALAKMGYVRRDENGDAKWYGEGSDDLACQLGAGMHPDLQKKILEFGSDNLVTEWSPVYSAQELADGIAAGGIGIGSDAQGFTMTRDADGFCRPSGVWYHYHIRCSVGLFGRNKNRKGFGYNQSWSLQNPDGPLLEGHPSNCFGVDWDYQDRLCKSGKYAVLFGFPLWELEQGGKDIPWIFS